MRNFLIVVGFLFLIFLGFILYNTYVDEKVPVLEIEDDKVSINELYIYGTHLNMVGNSNFIDKAELVLYDGEFITYNINGIDEISDSFDSLIDSSNSNTVDRVFSLSNYINDGIYLDNIPIGDYYLFLRVKDNMNQNIDNEHTDEISYKYYPLYNNTEYEETIYYTMSNFNKKIVIDSENSYPTMMMHVDTNCDDEIYDVVIDPGHGGKDGGANKNGYEETDFTMNIALKVKDNLEKYGLKVKLTHEKGQLSNEEKLEEYGIHGRAVVSSEVKAKYLFSIHLNSSESQNVSGLEVYTAKNINYNFARMIVNNITTLSGIKYSTNDINKVENGIYSRNFTKNEVDSSIRNYIDNDLLAYDITTNSNYYYMIRESGGIVTGAYVDDRNSEIVCNPYTNSNVGTEAYLLELGYLSNKNDLNNMINNLDKYVEGISVSIKSLYNQD